MFVQYKDTFLVAMPDDTQNCRVISFVTINKESLSTTKITTPSIADVDMLVAGNNGDIWVATNADSEILYLPEGGSQWIEVDLSYFGDQFSVYSMAWDSEHDKLLVYGSTSTGGMKMVEVIPAAYPPVVAERSPGSLYIPGTVTSLAVMDDPDDEDYGKKKITLSENVHSNYLYYSFSKI